MSHSKEALDALRVEIEELAAKRDAAQKIVADAEREATLKIEFERLEKEKRRIQGELEYAEALVRASGKEEAAPVVPDAPPTPDAPPAPDVLPVESGKTNKADTTANSGKGK